MLASSLVLYFGLLVVSCENQTAKEGLCVDWRLAMCYCQQKQSSKKLCYLCFLMTLLNLFELRTILDLLLYLLAKQQDYYMHCCTVLLSTIKCICHVIFIIYALFETCKKSTCAAVVLSYLLSYALLQYELLPYLNFGTCKKGHVLLYILMQCFVVLSYLKACCFTEDCIYFYLISA